MTLSKLKSFSIKVVVSWIKLLVIIHADKINVKKKSTTTLSSFTDGLIPSVTAMKSVGENHTDRLTDRTRLSV
jgi:hypothetical protein